MANPFPAGRVHKAATLFAALGDPTRLGLIVLLASSGPQSIAGLSQRTDVTRQAVTKHLHVLEEAGLIRGSRSGREHIWEVRPRGLADAQDHLARIDAQWDAALSRLERFVEDA